MDYAKISVSEIAEIFNRADFEKYTSEWIETRRNSLVEERYALQAMLNYQEVLV